MAVNEKSLIDLVQELPPALHGEVRDFVEFLLEKRRRTEQNGWPAGFIERTAGSITDPTFIRPPQGNAETRHPLE